MIESDSKENTANCTSGEAVQVDARKNVGYLRKVNLSFDEMLEFTRCFLVHKLGPHPAQIALTFLHFTTGTYVEDKSCASWKQPLKYRWMKELIRHFGVCFDFQSKRYTMHETVGGLMKRTIGYFTLKNSAKREYGKIDESLQLCFSIIMHPEKVILPDFPIFKDHFNFRIMSSKIAIRWFPSYGLLLTCNSGETEHLLKWESYECILQDEDSSSLQKKWEQNTFGQRRNKSAEKIFYRKYISNQYKFVPKTV